MGRPSVRVVGEQASLGWSGGALGGKAGRLSLGDMCGGRLSSRFANNVECWCLASEQDLHPYATGISGHAKALPARGDRLTDGDSAGGWRLSRISCA